MAIFNTLAGGYYGKLGATVGQRWKNKRTLRTYVIPANPRTEKQQANRGTFKEAIFYAQVAQAMNPKTKVFDTSTMTLWNKRMSLARSLQTSFSRDLERLPLYPQSFTPPILIERFGAFREYNSPSEILIEFDEAENLDGRKLVVAFTDDESNNRPENWAIGSGTVVSADGGAWIRFDRPLWEGELGDEPTNIGFVRCVSYDETDPTVDFIASESFDGLDYQGE